MAFGKFAVVLSSLMLLLDDAQHQQFLKVQAIGVDMMHGYAFGKPAPEL